MKSLALLALLLVAMPLSAANYSTTPFQFLKLDPDARISALGGAGVAVGNGAASPHFNPAGLVSVERGELRILHHAHLAGIQQDVGSLAIRLGSASVIGIMINRLDYGDIPRTTYAKPDGGMGNYQSKETAMSFSGAYSIGALSFGTGVKLLSQRIDDAAGHALAGDLGIHYRVPRLRGLAVGAAALNIGKGVRLSSQYERLPTILKVGAAQAFQVSGATLLGSAEISRVNTETVIFSGGLEVLFLSHMALRGGYSNRQHGLGISLGVGITTRRFDIDYSLSPFGSLGLTHRLSLSIRAL